VRGGSKGKKSGKSLTRSLNYREKKPKLAEEQGQITRPAKNRPDRGKKNSRGYIPNAGKTVKRNIQSKVKRGGESRYCLQWLENGALCQRRKKGVKGNREKSLEEGPHQGQKRPENCRMSRSPHGEKKGLKFRSRKRLNPGEDVGRWHST